MKKEIKQQFIRENYQCNISISEDKYEIGLIGHDEMTNTEVLDYWVYTDGKQLLNHLREVRFDKAKNYYLSFFTTELISVLYKNRIV